MRSFLLSVTPLLVALGVVGVATAAFADQDTPFTQNGVTAVCTGVGSAKDNPEWAAYPIKLVLANSAGENLAAAHFRVTRGGATVLETDCDAPWLLVKAPPGQYTATALVGEASRSTSFTAGNGPQKELTLMFGGGRRQASAQ
ncbi:MAG TPA: hypothetical protein VHM27_03015 [Rhizomicrobium sp.]|nr:hypothetical protein [Rhizomicrobium sp.]